VQLHQGLRAPGSIAEIGEVFEKCSLRSLQIWKNGGNKILIDRWRAPSPGPQAARAVTAASGLVHRNDSFDREPVGPTS
jgi:hypothetical protein